MKFLMKNIKIKSLVFNDKLVFIISENYMWFWLKVLVNIRDKLLYYYRF